MTRRLLALLAGALLAVLLSGCLNPTDFVATLTDQVMAGRDLYLSVADVTPKNLETQVSTWGSVSVVFDRDIDLTSLTPESIVFTPAASWTPTFNDVTNTLTIKPNGFESEKAYTVTLTGLIKGSDGSSLRSQYSWGFTTKKAPGGWIVIGDGGAYTNTDPETIEVHYNSQVENMRFSEDPAAFNDPDTPMWETKAASKPWPFVSGLDGSKTVYVQFKDASGGTTPPSYAGDTTTPICTSVTLDKTLPSANVAGPFPALLNCAAPSVAANATASDANGFTCAWTCNPPGAVTFSPSSAALNPTIYGACNWTTGVTVSLAVTDPAGNTRTVSGPSPMTVDTVAPLAPTMSIPPNPSLKLGTAAPTFYWASNGGNGTFQYCWNVSSGGSWSSSTSATSYAVPASSFGRDFAVKECDAALNWGTTRTFRFVYYPSYLYPAEGELITTSTPTLVFGPDVTPPSPMYLTLYFGEDPSRMERVVTNLLREKTYSILWKETGLKPLYSGYKYFWKYVLSGKVDYESPYYYFRY